MVNTTVELAAEDSEIASLTRAHMARLEPVPNGHCTPPGPREIPAEIDPAAKATQLMATGMGLMVVGKTNPGREVLETIVDTAFADLASGVSVAAVSRPAPADPRLGVFFREFLNGVQRKEGRPVRAIVMTQHGGPEVLETRVLPDPTPGPGEVLIRVRAFGLNHADTYMRSGVWSFGIPVLGIECVGVVEHDPSGRLAARATVLALVGGLARDRNGSYAELVTVPATNVVAVTTDLSWADLAAIPEVYATAWTALHGNLADTTMNRRSSSAARPPPSAGRRSTSPWTRRDGDRHHAHTGPRAASLRELGRHGGPH